MNKRIGSATRRFQRGITLLESLVSVVILAVAVLGMLGVQLRTLAETQTGVRRSQAVRLIEDLAERVRTNPGSFADLNSYTAYISDWNNVPTGVNCVTATCNSAALARWDIQEWKQSLISTLPNARASIFLSPDEAANPGNRRQLGVMVGWRANERSTNDPNYLNPVRMLEIGAPATCPVDLTCHLVYVPLSSAAL